MSCRSVLLVVLLSTSHAFAQAHLVRDIRVQTSPVSSAPGGLGTVGNITYFFATLPDSGTELWKTDGTAAGTVLVSDICPGPCSGVEQDYGYGIPVGNRLLFSANDGHQNGFRLWTTDGTPSGTMMLSSLTPVTQSGGLGTFVVSTGSLAFFNANDPATGLELWVTDGTVAGTHLVTDLAPGASGSSPAPVATFGSRLLFRAGSNRALYVTDGTEQGTHLVSPVQASNGIASGNFAFLSVFEADQSWSLWKTDGTTAGTTLVRGGFKNSIDQMVMAGNTMYFVADDGISGSEVWRSDGTASGTSLLADLTSGAAGSTLRLDTFRGSLLIFRNDGPLVQLWISDGTGAGTRLVTELGSITTGVTAGQRYVFAAQDPFDGFEAWSTDGTTAGTQLVSDINPGPYDGIQPFAFFLGRPNGVFFSATDGIHGVEPWVSDGTAGGTHMLKDLAPEKQLGSAPGSFAALGGHLVFIAYDGALAGLWMSDGTAPGTASFTTFTDDVLYGCVVNRGIVYFGIFSPEELWRSDGTTTGTFRLYHASDSGGGFMRIFPFKNGVLFDGQGGSWFSDGTLAGTHAISSVPFYGEMTAGDYFYGSANSQPYRTDGTAAGTTQITTTSAASESQLPGAFTQVGGSVYFAASLSDSAFNLWRSDMTTTQAVLVHHFDGLRAPNRMWSAGGGLMFFTNHALWRSDGTDAGTVKLLDNVEGMACAEDTDVIAGDGVLYWYNFANESAPELWRSDGTVPGTFKLTSLDGPYATSMQTCYARSMTYADGHLYFVGRDPVHGAEPWISDGTIAGTHLLDDVNPGVASSDPSSFLKIGPTLYFAATHPAVGTELWAITNPDSASCTLRRRAARP